VGSYKPNLNTVFRSINVAQNRQNGYFWYKFEKERIAYAIVTGLGTEEGVSGAHHHAKFHRCGFRNLSSLSQKNSKNGALKGRIHETDYCKISRGEDVLQVRSLTPNFIVVAL